MKHLVTLWIPVGLLSIWSIASFTRLVDPLFLPPPLSVAASLYRGVFYGTLGRDLTITIIRSLSGFTSAALLGIPLGLFVGRFQLLARATQPTIDFFRSVPAT